MFVYYSILLQKKDSVENVLNEFLIIRKSDALLGLIGSIPSNSDSKLKEQLYKKIKQAGLKYFEYYLKKEGVTSSKTELGIDKNNSLDKTEKSEAPLKRMHYQEKLDNIFANGGS